MASTTKSSPALFSCLECGRKFRTTATAERASYYGCPGCGGYDIDLAPVAKAAPAPVVVTAPVAAPVTFGPCRCGQALASLSSPSAECSNLLNERDEWED